MRLRLYSRITTVMIRRMIYVAIAATLKNTPQEVGETSPTEPLEDERTVKR